jgi:hypothetical protein
MSIFIKQQKETLEEHGFIRLELLPVDYVK